MSLEQQSTLISGGTFVLYIGVATWIFYLKRPILAGLAMGLIAFLPSFWQTIFTDSEAKGEGLLTVLLLFPALLITICGGVAALLRLAIARCRMTTVQGKR